MQWQGCVTPNSFITVFSWLEYGVTFYVLVLYLGSWCQAQANAEMIPSTLKVYVIDLLSYYSLGFFFNRYTL